MKHRKHRAWLLCLLCLITLFALSGCGKSSPKKDAAIKEDLITYGFEAIPGEESTLIEFAVNRRQTDKETRTDLVWCDVVYECEEKGRALTLKLDYELFDDEGWLLQEVLVDYESESMYYPLAYPDENDEAVQLYVDGQRTRLYQELVSHGKVFDNFSSGICYIDSVGNLASAGLLTTSLSPIDLPELADRSQTSEWGYEQPVCFEYHDQILQYEFRARIALRYNTENGCWDVDKVYTDYINGELNPDLFRQTFTLTKATAGFGMELLKRELKFDKELFGVNADVARVIRSLGAVTQDYSYTLTNQPVRVTVLDDGTVEYAIAIQKSANAISASLVFRADGSCYERNMGHTYDCTPSQLASFAYND